MEAAGGQAVLTDPALPSGSDRIFAALQALDPEGRHDVVVNLQGDLPALDPEQFARWSAALENSGADIATLARRNRRSRRRDNPAVVKAVVAWDADGRRAARFISPAPPRRPATARCFIMSGIYAYRRAALARFVALPPSPLETARKAGTVARAGSGHEHCGGARGQRALCLSILQPISTAANRLLHDPSS